MKRRELQECLRQLAEKYELRWIEFGRMYVGVHAGMIIEASEWNSQISFSLSAPSADVSDQFFNDFEGFQNCAEAGIPLAWIKTVIGDDKYARTDACELVIDPGRMNEIGVETFLRIPDLVSRDLQSFGAHEQLTCSQCENVQAELAAIVGDQYMPLCDDCWRDLQTQTTNGRLETDDTVRWNVVIPTLTVMTPIGGCLWGLIQQADEINFYFMLIPAFWAFGLCSVLCRISGGVTRILRLAFFLSVILSTFAGNIWGLRSHIIRDWEREIGGPVVGPDWWQSTRFYFESLPLTWRTETPFIAAGVFGAWLGFRMLRDSESISVR